MKKTWNIISTVLVLAVVVLAVLLAGVRLFGFTPYAILSPSMEPRYKTGDLVYVREKPVDQIVKGDVITFVADANLTVVTHRVDEVDAENRCFRTKGDANNVQDIAPVLYENVIGVVAFSLPKLGNLSMYLSTTGGKFAAAAVIFFLILLFLLPELFKKESKPEPDNDPAE